MKAGADLAFAGPFQRRSASVRDLGTIPGRAATRALATSSDPEGARATRVDHGLTQGVCRGAGPSVESCSPPDEERTSPRGRPLAFRAESLGGVRSRHSRPLASLAFGSRTDQLPGRTMVASSRAGEGLVQVAARSARSRSGKRRTAWSLAMQLRWRAARAAASDANGTQARKRANPGTSCIGRPVKGVAWPIPAVPGIRSGAPRWRMTGPTWRRP
jgi:hypothetical protein